MMAMNYLELMNIINPKNKKKTSEYKYIIINIIIINIIIINIIIIIIIIYKNRNIHALDCISLT